MWSISVVILTPRFNLSSRILQAEEDMLIEAFIAKLAVKALYVCILRWFPWLDKVQLYPLSIGPGTHSLADKFRTVVDVITSGKPRVKAIRSRTRVTRNPVSE